MTHDHDLSPLISRKPSASRPSALWLSSEMKCSHRWGRNRAHWCEERYEHYEHRCRCGATKQVTQ